jgi:RNA polymerase sigma factor (sigma-70 family)
VTGPGFLIEFIMKQIDISTPKHLNTYALVDDEDFDRINNMGKWCACKVNQVSIVARRTVDGKSVMMHRVIMNAPDGMDVDHKFHNTLDNQKENLRVCTHAENQKNRQKGKNNTSGYKGVTWLKVEEKWLATIFSDGKKHYVGQYDTPEQAATAYDIAALDLHGEYACLNEIDYTQQAPEPIDAHQYISDHDTRPPYLMGLSQDDLTKAIKSLTYREREIIKLRFGFGDEFSYTLEEIGRIFKVSRERVRQVEMKAVRKLKKLLSLNPDLVA